MEHKKLSIRLRRINLQAMNASFKPSSTHVLQLTSNTLAFKMATSTMKSYSPFLLGKNTEPRGHLPPPPSIVELNRITNE
jgi:hypothetical protein